MAEQTQKAFLRQPRVYLCSKKIWKGKRPEKGGNRFWKNIDLKFKTPREAMECYILAGTCHGAKMKTTISLIKLFSLYEELPKVQEKALKHPTHISPSFRVKEGDHVFIGRCK